MELEYLYFVANISIVVQLPSCFQLSMTPWTAVNQASLSFTISLSLSNSCSLSQRCHPTVLSFVVPFSSCPQSFPASGSFPVNQLFASVGQSIGASRLASVLPMNIWGWYPLGLTVFISLLFKGHSRVFSSATVQKHKFFSAQPLLCSNSHLHTILRWKFRLRAPLLYYGPCTFDSVGVDYSYNFPQLINFSNDEEIINYKTLNNYMDVTFWKNLAQLWNHFHQNIKTEWCIVCICQVFCR